MSEPSPLRPALFHFLEDLAQSNDRDWFQANKRRYEDDVKEAAFALISGFGPHLQEISPHFDAIPKATGGSLFRIYRDTRFSHDKRPYKTHTGIHFRHRQAKDAHAPGFYLHLEPSQVFIGMGIWHPDSPTLKAIREHIAEDGGAWDRIVASLGDLRLAGDSLKRPPKGFAADHPRIEDLKRKDFIATLDLDRSRVHADGFVEDLAGLYRSGAPLVEFLCRAVGVPF